jgi:hypothetical protein
MKLAVNANDMTTRYNLTDRRSQKRTIHQADLTGRPDVPHI